MCQCQLPWRQSCPLEGCGSQVPLFAGDIAVVGPALSALDADLAFQDPRTATKAKDARKNAAHFAAAQEARNMLGTLVRCCCSEAVGVVLLQLLLPCRLFPSSACLDLRQHWQ